MVCKLGVQACPFVWHSQHSLLHTAIEMPVEGLKQGVIWAFYWREKKLLFLKSFMGCLIFRLKNYHGEIVKCGEPALLGPGTNEVQRVDCNTVMVAAIDTRSRMRCFYTMKDDLAPRIFYSMREFPHFWIAKMGVLFMVAQDGPRCVDVASGQHQDMPPELLHDARTTWRGYWRAYF